MLFGARDPVRAEGLAAALRRLDLPLEITASPRDHLLQRPPAACLSAVVLDGVPDGALLRAMAEATAARPHLAVLVLGPIDSDLDALVALASGASGYLSSDAPPAAVADAVASMLAGEVVLSPPIAAALVRGLRAQGRGIVVHGPDGRTTLLTHREWEVLVLLRQGRTTAEIAGRFVVSAGTVRTHVGAIVRKLGVDNRAGLADLGTPGLE
jgi:DNA-binding NarL/FixJ family response regulator